MFDTSDVMAGARWWTPSVSRIWGGLLVLSSLNSGGVLAAPPEFLSLMEPVDLPSLEEPAVAAVGVFPDSVNNPMLFLPADYQRVSQLVLKLSERRLYAYLGDRAVASYPVAIGRDNWETPVGTFTIFQRQQNPAWEHPFTGTIVPPGPDNPLGARWLGFWTDGRNAIGFHGTPHEELIGTAVSHGCVRLRNADVIELYEWVELGTPVLVVP